MWAQIRYSPGTQVPVEGFVWIVIVSGPPPLSSSPEIDTWGAASGAYQNRWKRDPPLVGPDMCTSRSAGLAPQVNATEISWTTAGFATRLALTVVAWPPETAACVDSEPYPFAFTSTSTLPGFTSPMV